MLLEEVMQTTRGIWNRTKSKTYKTTERKSRYLELVLRI